MSDLSDLLSTQEEAIRQGFSEQLAHRHCEVFGEAIGGDCGAMLHALAACLPGGNPDAARTWARRMGEDAARRSLPEAAVMAGIGCLLQAIRHRAENSLTLQIVLAAAMDELDDAADVLRRYYLEARREGGQDQDILQRGFAAVVEHSPDFVLLATRTGKPVYLNRAGRRMVGLAEEEEFPRGSLHDYHPDDSWELLRGEAVPQVNRRDLWEGECQLRHLKNGESIEVQTTIRLVREPGSGRPCGLAVIHHPLVERRSIKDALNDSEARKRAILESALDPIISINHEGIISEFNRAAERVFGHPRAAVLGTRPSDVLFPPAKMGGVQDRIDRYLAAGEGTMLDKRSEVTAVRANGETFPAELAMTMNYENGRPVMTFFVRDISERKRAEEEQTRYAAELERSNRELEQFAYVASHDLQEPLRKIRTFGDRLMISSGANLDQTGRECLERMQNAAERMQSLILGLLSLSRVTTKGQDFVPVDLAEIARDVVSDLEVVIEQAGALVDVGKMPTIQADPLQIRQLLQNLIGNALKFRNPTEPPVIKVHARFLKDRAHRQAGDAIEDEMCRLVVEDNGIGFDQKYAERIFGIFQRLHTREEYSGTGIGLAICRKIAERHGGTIKAESCSGHGATFTVLLPVVHRKPKAGD